MQPGGAFSLFYRGFAAHSANDSQRMENEMSLLDGILKSIGGAPDDVANLAEKVGIDPAMAEKAIATLGQTHQMQGDTVELASAKTGLDTGDGDVIDDVTDMAKGLFGKK